MLKRLMEVFAAPDDAADTKDHIALAAAVLLLEVAHTDGDFHKQEQALLGELLQRHFDVATGDLDELMALAEKTRRDSADLHQFTRQINSNYSQSEKEEIIVAVWRLVFADGRLDHYEEALMRQLGTLIGLSHRQLIEAKMKVAGSH